MAEPHGRSVRSHTALYVDAKCVGANVAAEVESHRILFVACRHVQFKIPIKSYLTKCCRHLIRTTPRLYVVLQGLSEGRGNSGNCQTDRVSTATRVNT